MAEAFAERMEYMMSEILELVMKDLERAFLEFKRKRIKIFEFKRKCRKIFEFEIGRKRRYASTGCMIAQGLILQLERESLKWKIQREFLERISLKWKITRKLMKKVKDALDKFESTLGDELHDDKIQKREDKSDVWLWVGELEDLTYETEDALDKWRVIISDELVSRRRFQLLAQCCIPAYRWASANLEAEDGLKWIVATTISQVETLLSKGMKFVEKTKLKRPESFPDGDDERLMVASVREYDKGCLLEHLLSPDPEDGSGNRRAEVKVISIVGFGGSGKTTLARSLYNHHRVVAYFQVRVWVHVSGIFDERMIATKLLDFLGTAYAKESELESLLHLLRDFFSGKTVLVVFDDVWIEEASKWEQLKKSLGNSSILVTTRSERAAKAACSTGILHTLAPISVEECSLILKSYIGQDGGRVHNTAVEKCEGSPLVARILGMKLQSKDTAANEVYMEEVCMVRFRQFYHTYDTLPPYMKSCLLYPAAFFPKGAVIDALKLVLLWKSQGYLGYPAVEFADEIGLCPREWPWEREFNERKDKAYGNVENKGSECLTRLIGHLFFEKIESQSIHKPHPISYKMPDAAHDFVTYMAHLHGDHRKGRSYFITPGNKVTPDLFGQLKRMTALILSSSQLDELPEEVRLLTRLQYLDLSDNPLKQLPPTVCELYHLEFLDVECCYLLSCLPEKIGKLRQMRHLRINHTTEELHDLPSGFRDLALLQTLDVLRVGGKYKDAVNKLWFLKNLVHLCISFHGESRYPAILEYNNSMKTLELHFVGEGRNQEMASSVARLTPPPSLQMLKFEHYPGFTLPRWILRKSLINNLTRLSLRSAVNISSLPDLWILSSLEFLWLYDISNLKHLGCEFFGLTNTPKKHHTPEASSQHMRKDDDLIEEINDDSETNHGEITVEDPLQEAEREEAAAFRSLKTFRIEYLENWETWEDANEADEVNIKVMPCLEELIIAHCPKLQGMPLRILRDTPWFKSSYQREEAKSTGGAHEKNVKLPPPADNKNKLLGTNHVALKATYIKLRKFVRDAYMTKAPAQHLKVSIPEGVLGKTAETSYLQIDYLHDWFEKDRSIFDEQMCVWSKHIYELMTPSDKERVQMASSALTTTVGRQEHFSRRAENLVDFMMENKAKLYLVPFLRPGHWELLAIVPETEVIYWFDSLQGNISQELTEILNMVERKYVTRNLNSAIANDSWKVVDIKHKRQVDNWECGYYVMIWMHKIALEIQDLNLESHFPTDTSSYEPDKLTEVDWKWCSHVIPEFLA